MPAHFIHDSPDPDTSRNIVITCARGAVPLLRDEVLKLGLTVTEEGASAVTTGGNLDTTMLLNLELRTAQRVYYAVAEFAAGSPQDLYDGVSRVCWERYLAADGYLSVASAADADVVSDGRYVNVKAKDAIVDRLRRVYGRRPESGPERDRAVIYVRWRAGLCSVYLDTSGESLSKRGYRRNGLSAPLQEALAAAIVMSTRWQSDMHLVNPMAGSGTLAIEAALIALDRAPGLTRSNFGFMHLKGFDRERWDTLVAAARGRRPAARVGRIIASDRSPAAVAAARENAVAAGVAASIELSVCDFAETPVPAGGGIVIMNPEYGERMGDAAALGETYARIGDYLKQRCRGYAGYIFTGNLDLAKKVGLRTSRRTTFFNGAIECRLLEYELYEGSRKRMHDPDRRALTDD